MTKLFIKLAIITLVTNSYLNICNLTIVEKYLSMDELGEVYTTEKNELIEQGYYDHIADESMINKDFTPYSGRLPPITDFAAPDNIFLYLQENSWFDLKDCYYDNADLYRPYLLHLIEFREVGIKAVLKANFCSAGEEDWEKDEDNTLLPDNLKTFFKGTIWKLTCRESEKVLLINSFGSSSPTSDYDFSLFIYDLEDDIDENKEAPLPVHGAMSLLEASQMEISPQTQRVSMFVDKETVIKQVKVILENIINNVVELPDIESQQKDDRKTKIMKNMLLTVQLITGLNKDFVGLFTGGNLGEKLDSNAYPDIMVADILLFKDEPSTVEQKEEARMFRIASVIGVCEIAPLILKKDEHLVRIFGFEDMFDECIMMLGKKINIHEGDIREHEFYRKFLVNSARLSDKNRYTLASCIGNAMAAPEQVNLSLFKTLLSICHVHVDEAYLSLGALEFYKYGSSMDTFNCTTLMEAFVENMSMLIVHIHELGAEAVDSRAVSDKFAKYFMRAMKAVNFEKCRDFDNVMIQRQILSPEEYYTYWLSEILDTDKYPTHLFNIDPVNHDHELLSKTKQIKLAQEQQTQGLKESLREMQLAIEALKEKQKIGVNTDIPIQNVLEVPMYTDEQDERIFHYKEKMKQMFGNDHPIQFSANDIKKNVAGLLILSDNLQRVRKARGIHIEDPEFEYQNDETKKKLYNNHFKEFIKRFAGTPTISVLIIQMQYFMKYGMKLMLKNYLDRRTANQIVG